MGEMNPFGIKKAMEPYETPKGEVYFEDRGPGYKGQTQGARSASRRDKVGFKPIPKTKQEPKPPPFEARHPAGAHPDDTAQIMSRMFRNPPDFRSNITFETPDMPRYEMPKPKRLSGGKKALLAAGGLGAIGTAAVAANMADDRRRAKRKVAKRDDKKKYTALGIAAGGAAAGGTGAYLLSRGRASKVVLKPVEAAIKAPKPKIKAVRLPGTPEGLKPPTDLPPSSQPGVSNVTPMDLPRSKAAENARNAARRVADKDRAAAVSEESKKATEAELKPIPINDPNLKDIPPDATIEEVERILGADKPKGVGPVPQKMSARAKRRAAQGKTRPNKTIPNPPEWKPADPFTHEGRSLFGKNAFGVSKSFVRAPNGDLIAKPITALKATGKLADRVHPMGDAGSYVRHHSLWNNKPIPIENRSNVSIADARTAQDVSGSWRMVRRWADGHPEGGMMEKPTHTWRKNGRKVKAGDVSPLGSSMKWQNFSATAGNRSKNGYQVGSQRQATAVVALNPKLKPGQRKSYKAHEMTHVDVRKPMSRDVRHYRHPEKMWGDEGRADMAMAPKERKRSAYLWATKFKPMANALPGRYKEGFDAGGGKKYTEVQAKIRAARIKSGDTSERPVHTKRNVILATTGAGVGAGAAGGAYAYKKSKEAS